MARTVENAMPAVTTELDWTVQDLLRFMIQTGRFRDSNGTISEARVEAAKAYLATDWDKMAIERWKAPGFDPERPFLEQEEPDWRKNKPEAAEQSRDPSGLLTPSCQRMCLAGIMQLHQQTMQP